SPTSPRSCRPCPRNRPRRGRSYRRCRRSRRWEPFVVLEAVLPGRPLDAQTEAVHVRRLVPEGVGKARVELRAVVASRVPDDYVVIAGSVGEEIKISGGELVWRVALADLQRA